MRQITKLQILFAILFGAVILLLYKLDRDTITFLVSMACLSLLYYLSQMAFSVYKEEKIYDDIEKVFPMSNFEVGYNTLTVQPDIEKATFYSGNIVVGEYVDNILIAGKEFNITKRDITNVLTQNGYVVATSKEDLENEYCCFIFSNSKGFYVKPLNAYGFPFGVYHQDNGYGLIRPTEIVLPRDVPIEVQMFMYIIVTDISVEINRRIRRRSAP